MVTRELTEIALDYLARRPLGVADPHMWFYSRCALNVPLTAGGPPESTGSFTASGKERERRTCLDPCFEIVSCPQI